MRVSAGAPRDHEVTAPAWTMPDLWTRRRAHRSLENCADAVFHMPRHHRQERMRKQNEDNSETKPYMEANTG